MPLMMRAEVGVVVIGAPVVSVDCKEDKCIGLDTIGTVEVTLAMLRRPLPVDLLDLLPLLPLLVLPRGFDI